LQELFQQIFKILTYTIYITCQIVSVYILGISAFYHDSAAAIVKEGAIIAAAQEERFTRKKNDADFPIQAVQYCLEEAGIGLHQINAIVFYDKPLLKFERLLETYYRHAPQGLVSFINAMPVWTKQKLFLRSTIKSELNKIGAYDAKKIPLLFTEHHLSHAASAYFASPFQESAILTLDGVGEWATATIGKAEGNAITILKELHYPNSIGLLYSAFTYFLGFEVNNGEYKVMGLAPYGNPNHPDSLRYIERIKDTIIKIYPDGSIELDQQYFTYSTSMRMVKDKKWAKIFDLKKRESKDALTQQHCNLAYALQVVTEEIVLKLATTTKQLTGSENLCMSGGVALNCVANGKLAKAGLFKNIFIQPASGDAGGALGAALAAAFIYFNQDRKISFPDALNGSYLGPDYSEKELLLAVNAFEGKKYKIENHSELCELVTDKMLNGKVIGWFQDRMEFGPRALGNRSILADCRNEEMQYKVNMKVKFRESFRPFAPILLEEEMERLFEFQHPSPYMLFVAPVKSEFRAPLPAGYDDLEMKEKLSYVKSDFPAISHVDLSSRLQTVSEVSNPKMFELLTTFKKRTGIGMLLNTSFNVKDEPIVCSPIDALNCFLQTDIEILVLGNYILEK
jgi:carbamoyltransferase